MKIGPMNRSNYLIGHCVCFDSFVFKWILSYDISQRNYIKSESSGWCWKRLLFSLLFYLLFDITAAVIPKKDRKQNNDIFIHFDQCLAAESTSNLLISEVPVHTITPRGGQVLLRLRLSYSSARFTVTAE